MEKRSGGKMATILMRVEGDADALLGQLKKRLATGGHAKDGAIELQGDHRDAVVKWLDEHLRGQAK